MGFIKVVKNKSYFKRFQVKYRRRREGKTDYRARKRLTSQAKNKYNTPKYRLVVRFTNKDVIAQIIFAKIKGDVVISAAYSHELRNYGLKVGLTNYAASYATGLLLARRLLTKLGLAAKFVGKIKVTGEDWHYDLNRIQGPKPFKAALDVGLARTSTGARVFAVLKGACDGGLNIPHSDTRFAGYDSEAQTLNAEVLRKYIFGGHVAEYMRHLQETDQEGYRRQFSEYIKNGINADDLEALYLSVHKAIRKDPTHKKSEKPAVEKPKRYGQRKRSPEQRWARIRQKKQAALKAAGQ
jgi:large subunit ribosomal protein L5e